MRTVHGGATVGHHQKISYVKNVSLGNMVIYWEFWRGKTGKKPVFLQIWRIAESMFFIDSPKYLTIAHSRRFVPLTKKEHTSINTQQQY